MGWIIYGEFSSNGAAFPTGGGIHLSADHLTLCTCLRRSLEPCQSVGSHPRNVWMLVCRLPLRME